MMNNVNAPENFARDGAHPGIKSHHESFKKISK